MERRLAAILAADMVGYSRLMAADEMGTIARQKTHRKELIDPKIAEYGGRVVKTTGDGVLVEFASVVDALRCAVTIQLAMQDREANVPPESRIAYRVGINLGDIVVENDDIYGDGVNVAARLEALAEPGGICVSRTVVNHVKGRVSSDFEDLGEQRVKNIPEPLHVFRVRMVPEEVGEVVVRTQFARWRIGFISTIAAAILLLVIWTAAIILWQPWSPAEQPAGVKRAAFPLPDKPSVAVLPFTNLSDDKAQEYFADGITDDLITDLSKVSGLFVIARNSAFTFKGRAKRIEEIARELGVRYVVEGSVRRAGKNVRVNAQLVDGVTGGHVWAERYNREASDLFAMQDELVRRIVLALAVHLTQAEEAQIRRLPTTNLEAYDLYLRARNDHLSGEAVRLRESLELYQQALSIDPKFAQAYAGYARATADIWRLRSVRQSSGPLNRKAAKDAAQKAIDLDPSTADAYSVLALLEMGNKNHGVALQFARQAVELDPNSADAHTALTVVLGYAGHPKRALEAIRTAVRLNPRPPPYYWTYYGWTLFLNRKYDEAATVLEPIADTRGQALADSPREILAMAYAEAGHLKEAHEQVRALLEQDSYVNIALYRALYGHHARGEDLSHRIEALRKAGMPEWPFDFKGDPDQRLESAALSKLVSGTTWSGRDAARRQDFIQEFGTNDDVVFATATTLLTGKAYINGEEICERFEIITLGREGCGAVYQNPSGTAKNRDKYIYVNPTSVRYFSLDE